MTTPTFRICAAELSDDGSAALRYDLDGVEVVERFSFPVSTADPAAWEVAGRLVDLLAVFAGTSYFKVRPDARVVADGLGPQWSQVASDVYTHGLAEFAYRNSVTVDVAVPATGRDPSPFDVALPAGLLVPVGGGKDSVVTVELLRRAGHVPTLFAVNPKRPQRDTAAVAGLPLLEVSRALDAKLSGWNAAGALNGHVPVTAIVSVAALVCAVLNGLDTVVMSNERSADEPTLLSATGPVNHQWSKSSVFETALTGLLEATVHGQLAYGSLLRPVSELAIVSRFAAFEDHFATFTSCNAVFRLSGAATAWCGDCPKCRFVYLGLATRLDPDTLAGIFGSDLLADQSQTGGFAALAALGDDKPFECVGEAAESASALKHLAQPGSAWAAHPVVVALASKVTDAPALAELLEPGPARSHPRIAGLFTEVWR